MERGDVISILAALIIVSLIAVVFNPAAGEDQAGQGEIQTPGETPYRPPDAGAAEPSPSPTAPPVPEPYRIRYNPDYLTYPRHLLPPNMGTFGGSDILWKSNRTIPFAYVEESGGGLTETFSVPYPVWRMNCTVYAERRPHAAHISFILVDAGDGTIVEGAELWYSGSVVKNVQSSDAEYYLIVGCDAVDRYRIDFETLPAYASA
ncbi:hypothetical protein FGU65_05995 [Methanoculleus sp. FWC-SCC1]|uniref:Uncharacterized protein n=1 Tax=Methanoculleus frigidifontis TaxID=2584085 RepID=A0ABT8M928_9EURY|nr:hypothetical protein [Methanoculleus sp. FWC-SCC1]MDN7024443.1 hypothetical protein [Methanoculleus sp. FWC-SCC1]